MSGNKTIAALENANKSYMAALDAHVECCRKWHGTSYWRCAEEKANVEKQKSKVKHYRFLLSRDYHGVNLRNDVSDHP